MPEYPKSEAMTLLHTRGSVRNFEDKPIPEELLQQVLQAGIHAPTGGNLQPYSIIRIENRETNIKLGEMCWQKFIGTAAVNLLFCIDWRRNRRLAEIGAAPFTAQNSFRHFWISFQDTIITAQNICTAADAAGLGSCYIGTILEHMETLIEMCELPDGVFPVVLLCLGYPKTGPSVANKLGQEIMVHHETYSDIPGDQLFEAYLSRERHRKLEPTDERMEKLRSVCRKIGGEDLVQHCEQMVGDANSINPVQYRFGLHYPADEMPVGNPGFIELFRKMGFGWFDDWSPPGHA
jgi:nitroreductase